MKLHATIINGKLEIMDKKALTKFNGRVILTIEKYNGIRSLNQNDALHLWFSQIEEHCQELGLTVDVLFKNPAEIPINRHYIKDFFRELGKFMFKKDSTAKLDKDEFSKVEKVFEKEIAERLDCTIPFPSIDVPIEDIY